MARVLFGGCFIIVLLVEPAVGQAPGGGWAAVQLETAKHGYLNARMAHQVLLVDVTEVLVWSRRIRDAELSVAKDAAGRVAAAKAQLDRIDSLRPVVSLSGLRLKDAVELDYEYHDAERVMAQFDPEFKQELAAKMAALAMLQGRWRTVRVERKGKLDDDVVEILDVRGGIVRKSTEQASGVVSARAFIALNPVVEPMEIDLVGLNDDFIYFATGIVAVEGDRMRICLSGDKNDRPDRFATSRRDANELFLLERVEREKAPEEP